MVITFRFFNVLFFKSNFGLTIFFLLPYRKADREGVQWFCPEGKTPLSMYGGVSYQKGEKSIKCNI